MDRRIESGQIFLPKDIVENTLNEVGYKDGNILNKKIFVPSFGDGFFLTKIIKKLINHCESISMSKEKIKEQLENNVYGVEMDEILYNKTLEKLNIFAEMNDIKNIDWKLYNQDIFTYTNYDFFDFVVGKPQNIITHDLSEEIKDNLKDYNFTEGMTDMYIIFFGLGIKFLNKKGKLGYITPNSYMKNTSQGIFRKYLIKENLIEKIFDYGLSKSFDNTDTYTAITILSKHKDDYNLIYNQVDDNRVFFVSRIDLKDYINIENKSISSEIWKFNGEESNNILELTKNRELKLEHFCNIQYGISANKNSIYIINPKKTNRKKILVFEKDGKTHEIEGDILRRVVNGSIYNGKDDGKKIIFPYEYNKEEKVYKPIPEETMKKTYPLAYKYLSTYKNDLEALNMDKSATVWYQYAKNQELNNIPFKKLLVKNNVNPMQNKIEVYELPEKTVIYSGMFITSINNKTLKEIKEIIESEEFYKHALSVGKYMSGGYKSISSKHIKVYNANKLIKHLPCKFHTYSNKEKDEFWDKYITDKFLLIIKEACDNYSKYGATSNKKISPIHLFIAEAFQLKLGNSYYVKSICYDIREETNETAKNAKNNNEETIKGKYFDKLVDICVSKDGEVLFGISVKFICSNFFQNANNYCECMLGETANIKSKGYPYAQLIIFPEVLPYYKDGGIISKKEEINSHYIKKYIEINNEPLNVNWRPDLISIIMINTYDEAFLDKHINENKRIKEENKKNKKSAKLAPINIKKSGDKFKKDITYANIDENPNFDEETKEFLLKHGNINDFLNNIVSLIISNEINK